MGAHEIPIDYRGRREDYVRLVIDEMIPAVAERDWRSGATCSARQGVFTPDESARILAGRGARAG